MELTSVSREEIMRLVGERLGVSHAELASVELLAASLRRAAGLLCPTTPRALVDNVQQSFSLLQSDTTFRDRIRETLDEMLAHGDLMEFDEVDTASAEGAAHARLVYAAPLCFVRISKTRLFVVGITPDAVDPLASVVTPVHEGVLRKLLTKDGDGLPEKLRLAGLYELPYDVWAKAPTKKPSSRVVQQFDRALDQAPPSGPLDEVRVLNTAVHTPWYLDRWKGPQGLTGRYVATRPRRFGADLWCYLELQDGESQRLIDLPQGQTSERGCDQAWRLQCALDAESGTAQAYRLTPEGDERVRLDIHIPCPAWLLRRWECIGHRLDRSVFSFLFAADGVDEEATLIESQLWMAREY